MPRHRLLPPLLALALVLGAAACGKQPTIQRRLADDTAAAVRALNAKDVSGARRALDALDADLIAAERLGQLGSSKIGDLRAGVRRLRADLALLAPVLQPTPTPVRTGAPSDEHGHGKKRRGDGNGDNGD